MKLQFNQLLPDGATDNYNISFLSFEICWYSRVTSLDSGSMTAGLLPLCQFCGILYGFQLDLTDQSDLAEFSWTGTIFFKNRFYYRMTLHKTSQF